jgi:von Willebrand factor A domain-containing protein 8
VAISPAFRSIATGSRTLPLKDWLTDEHANTFFTIPSLVMDRKEERKVLEIRSPDAPSSVLDVLLDFADKYRRATSADTVLRSVKLGTRSLIRLARQIVASPDPSDLKDPIRRNLLAECLPITERMVLEEIFAECNIKEAGIKVGLLSIFRGDPCSVHPSAV